MTDFSKKAAAVAMAVCFAAVALSGCTPQGWQDNFWQDFFDGAAAASGGENAAYSLASDYFALNKQGAGGWYYGSFGEDFQSAEFDGGVWKSGGAELDGDKLTSLPGCSAARMFQSSRTGENTTVCGTLKGYGGASVELDIYKNDQKVYSGVEFSCGDAEGIYYELTLDLNEGDELIFALDGDGAAGVDPLIIYDAPAVKIHPVNQTGYWGDLIPCYNAQEKAMYMYYMTGDVSDLAHPKIDMHLAVSKDMVNYEERPFEVMPFVDKAVNLGFYRDKFTKFFDYETFPEGYRDTYMFFDRQIQRWRYVALCYYSASGMIRCALGTGVSLDEEGQSWGRIKILKNYPLFKQPECPFAAYINDRWYIGCSLWGESIHNVGRMRYYIGDKGKSIDEQDWLGKEEHYIDGEDLCAAQLVDVGGKYLMYGWIVRCYEDAYFPQVIDNGLWGGAMNIPREIYQKENGVLGARLPGELKNLLKKGVMARAASAKTGPAGFTIDGDFPSAYISFGLDMQSSQSASATLVSGGKEYTVSIRAEDGKSVLTIGCPQDTTHPVAAVYDMAAGQKFDVSIISEDNVLEVFVNDEYALSARTSMFSGRFEKLVLSSDGAAEFKNIKINKLANSADLYR